MTEDTIMRSPKFSVLLPTHNRLELLKRALYTVLNQDFDDWEVIVSDNFSNEPIEQYVASLGDDRIKYLRTQEFIPVTENWQYALDHSRGDYVIMLGDDDGLLQGYFSTLNAYLDEYNHPDVVYTGALLFAYPGVLPGCKDGFLRSYENREIYENKQAPFILDKEKSKQFVLDSMQFKVSFDYNMQFSLVSKRLINQLKEKGAFYQSPYPDYYASNVILWEANEVLVVPQPSVVVGISPKSFGYYYFNDSESEGNKFLFNSPHRSMAELLKATVLPGPSMNTSWLYSMEQIAKNFPEHDQLKPNHDRYRFLQICAVFADLIRGKEEAQNAYDEMRPLLTEEEWLEYGVRFTERLKSATPETKSKLALQTQTEAASHPSVAMPSIGNSFPTMIEVFDSITPMTP